MKQRVGLLNLFQLNLFQLNYISSLYTIKQSRG